VDCTFFQFGFYQKHRAVNFFIAAREILFLKEARTVA